MKKLIVFAITCLMGINVVAMEEDFSVLSSEEQESFFEDPNILDEIEDWPVEFIENLSPTGNDFPVIQCLPSSKRYVDLTTMYKFVSGNEQLLAEIRVPSKGITPIRKTKKDDSVRSGSGSRKVRKFESINCSVPSCNLRYNDRVVLRNHERDAHKKSTYVCMLPIKQRGMPHAICLQKFLSNNKLIEHYKEHKSIFCLICNNNRSLFRSFDDLKGHYSREHSYSMNTRFCGMCNQVQNFDSEFSLYTHLKEKHNLLSWPE